jgi:MFS family permease
MPGLDPIGEDNRSSSLPDLHSTPPSAPRRKQGMFSSLVNRDFRYLWFGSMAAAFAMQMQMVARGWLIYDMTQSPIQLAWVMMSFSLPMILFSLFGGVAADRLTKKSVMAVSQSANCVATFALAAIVITGNIEFWHFVVFGIFNGTIMSFSMPSRQAVIPEIVGDDQLVNAVALNSATMNLSRVLGPAFAGVFIAMLAGGDTGSHFAVGMVFMANAVLYAISVATILVLRHQGRSTLKNKGTIFGDVNDGLRYIWNHELLRGLIIMTTIPLLFGFPMQTLMPVFNHDVLGGGPDDLGVLMSVMGGGAIVGSFILARLSDTKHKGNILFGTALAWALCVAGFAVSKTLTMAMLACAMTGLTSSVFMSLHMSVVTLIIEPQMRGRVMSIMMMTFGLMPVGALPAAYFAETIGIDVALLGCAVGLAVLTFALAAAIPGLRSIDTHKKAPMAM